MLHMKLAVEPDCNVGCLVVDFAKWDIDDKVCLFVPLWNLYQGAGILSNFCTVEKQVFAKIYQDFLTTKCQGHWWQTRNTCVFIIRAYTFNLTS